MSGDAGQAARRRQLLRLSLTAVALCAGLNSCARPARAEASRPTITIKEGQNLRPGTPSLLGLNWNASSATNHDHLIKAGWIHTVRRTGGKEGTILDIYRGQIFGRPAQLQLEHEDRRYGLLRAEINIIPARNYGSEYRRVVELFSRRYGPAPSLFTPQPPTDAHYREASRQNLYPVTAWIFKNGFATAVAVTQPWRSSGDTRTTIRVTIESELWRYAYRL